MNGAVHLLHCLSPLHNGAGEGAAGIDRPIVREAVTNYPYVQSSSLKGTARALATAQGWSSGEVDACFGSDKHVVPAAARQGALVVGDANILLFPLQSAAATWVWMTAPTPLARLVRLLEIGRSGLAAATLARATTDLLIRSALLTQRHHGLAGANDQVLRTSATGPYILANETVEPIRDETARTSCQAFAGVLSSVVFPKSKSLGSGDYWRTFMSQRVMIVSDARFLELVERHTLVEPGIEIEDTGATKEGSLRFTEFLPEESVLASFVAMDPLVAGLDSRDWPVEYGRLTDDPFQVGGDETKGKGLLRSVLVT